MNFTREQQQKRLERFLSLLAEQHLCQYEVHSNTPGKTFIVYSESDLARVHLGAMGGIQLTARNGQLKNLLRTWIARERPSFDDRTSPEAFAQLDAYRYLLQAPAQGLPSDRIVHMIPGHSPRPVVKGKRLHDHPAKSDVHATQGWKVLQIIPAQPDWWAVFAAPWEIEEGADAFYRAPLIGWALVEEGNETDVVAMVVLAPDNDSEPDATIWLVGEKGEGFLGFQYPGAATDWNAFALKHRQVCLDERTRWWNC